MLDFEELMRTTALKIEKWGLEYAEKKSLSNNLDDLKKTILSVELLKHQDLPAWKAEAQARTSEAYRLHLENGKRQRQPLNL